MLSIQYTQFVAQFVASTYLIEIAIVVLSFIVNNNPHRYLHWYIGHFQLKIVVGWYKYYSNCYS